MTQRRCCYSMPLFHSGKTFVSCSYMTCHGSFNNKNLLHVTDPYTQMIHVHISLLASVNPVSV